MNTYAATGAVFMLCGCAASPTHVDRSYAIVNDVAVPEALDSGYRIVAVDGNPVERRKGSTQTVVPFAIVDPGTHTLTLESTAGEDRKVTTLSAQFKAGKRYRLGLDVDDLMLVEESY